MRLHTVSFRLRKHFQSSVLECCFWKKRGVCFNEDLEILTFPPCLPLASQQQQGNWKKSNGVEHSLMFRIRPSSPLQSVRLWWCCLSFCQRKSKCRRSDFSCVGFQMSHWSAWFFFSFSCRVMVRFKVSNHAGKSLDEPTCPLVLIGLYHIPKTNEFGVRQQVV